MATNYPGSLDAFTNPTSSNTLDSPSHSLQHSDLNDAVEAIETKLGAGAATPGTATAYYPLVAGTAGATSWTQLTYQGITAGSATSGQVLTAGTAGTTTWSTPTPGGLVLIKTYTPTNVASLSLDAGTFTSTYKNYVIKGYLRNTTTSSTVSFKYRAAGVDTSGSDYNTQELFAGSTSLVGTRTLSSTGHLIFVLGNTWDANFELNLYRPQEAAISSFNSYNFRSDGVSIMFDGGYHNQAVSYDSLSFINSSSNFTGQIQVFGVSQ